MTIKRFAVCGAIVATLATGCSVPRGPVLQHLDPEAPAAVGLPPWPAPNQPAPVNERPPFGLYSEKPSSDTLASVATGGTSPNGRYRVALTAQGAWVARADAAWLWQIQLPEVTTAGSPESPPPATIRSVDWTDRGTLLIKDSNGRWLEANPDMALVSALPPGLQGKEVVSFSPDTKQVLYYINDKNEQQLWVSNIDGSKATSLGTMVVGMWDEQGKLVVTRIAGPPYPVTPVGKLPVRP